jgi:hypothetical protein
MHQDHDARRASPTYDLLGEDCVTSAAPPSHGRHGSRGHRHLAMTSGVTGTRMAWVCTELILLWLILPVLLWTDALPVVYRIAVLVVAAVYALWVVWLERVRWDELGFRGLIGFLPSCAQGALGVAASVPVLALATATFLGRHSVGAPPPVRRTFSAFSSSMRESPSPVRSSSTRLSSSGAIGPSSLPGFSWRSTRWSSPSLTWSTTHGSPSCSRWPGG